MHQELLYRDVNPQRTELSESLHWITPMPLNLWYRMCPNYLLVLFCVFEATFECRVSQSDE